MAAMSSLGRLGLSSRRGLILITNNKSTMVRSEPFMVRGLSTSVRRDERFFTKKHEWVEVEGTKGELYHQDLKSILCHLLQARWAYLNMPLMRLET